MKIVKEIKIYDDNDVQLNVGDTIYLRTSICYGKCKINAIYDRTIRIEYGDNETIGLSQILFGNIREIRRVKNV